MVWVWVQGSARDLGAVRSHMQLAQPDMDFLMSKCNQDRTSDGLQVMGHRLAVELAHYLQVPPHNPNAAHGEHHLAY